MSGAAAETAVALCVLDGFSVRVEGADLRLQPSTQRLLACLALHGPTNRALLAATLWLDLPEERAAANLRSSLWRLRRAGRPLVAADGERIRLATGVCVDHDLANRCVHQLVVGAPLPVAPDEAITLLSADILPAWWEEWVVEERERYRQRRLHALEHLGARLRDAGRHALALEAGLAAVTAEPLRESAQRLVVSIHLAEGNRGEALAQYDRFARLLRHALGCAPSPQMEALVA